MIESLYGTMPVSHRVKRIWATYGSNAETRTGVAILLVVVAISVVGRFLVGSPTAQHYDAILVPPSTAHLLGTDNLGRDVLARVIVGAGVSLFVGAAVVSIAMPIGIAIGMVAGYFGGAVDEVLARIIDFVLTVPVFFLILVVAAVFSRGLGLLILILGLTFWPSTARLMRSQYQSYRQRDFVMAAESSGAGPLHLMFREILPHAIYVAVVQAGLSSAAAILAEASLGFLGLGDPSAISLGGMLQDAIAAGLSAWWLVAFPGIAISLIVIGLNLLSDGLNHSLNPRLSKA